MNVLLSATNHFVHTDNELKDVQWIADQYLTHAFHVAADSKCAFTRHLVGLEGDGIVLFMKLQSTDTLCFTHTKTMIHSFKTV